MSVQEHAGQLSKEIRCITAHWQRVQAAHHLITNHAFIPVNPPYLRFIRILFEVPLGLGGQTESNLALGSETYGGYDADSPCAFLFMA